MQAGDEPSRGKYPRGEVETSGSHWLHGRSLTLQPPSDDDDLLGVQDLALSLAMPCAA